MRHSESEIKYRGSEYLLRDRDRIYGYEFRKQLEVMDIEEVLSAPRSPWQRAYIERLIGSIRRECLDHMIVFNEESLRHLLRAYVHYYHSTRLHLSLERDAPDHRPVQSDGKIVAMSQVGGLHYRYERDAASIGLRLLIFWLSWPSLFSAKRRRATAMCLYLRKKLGSCGIP